MPSNIRVPDLINLAANRVVAGDTVDFISKFTATQGQLETFSAQLVPFRDDLLAVVNTLEYEKGVWSPFWNDGTINVTRANYVRHNDLVTVWATLEFMSPQTQQGPVSIGGLPFFSAVNGSIGPVMGVLINYKAGAYLNCFTSGGQYVMFYVNSPSTFYEQLQNSVIQQGSLVTLSLTYPIY